MRFASNATLCVDELDLCSAKILPEASHLLRLVNIGRHRSIGLFWIASTQGVNVTVFIAGFGIVGLVIAFAMQDTMANFFSGIFLMTDRPFKVGDTILIDGDYCRVEKIGLRTTWLYNRFDHDIIIFPNNEIAGNKIVNLTQPDQSSRPRSPSGSRTVPTWTRSRRS